MRVVIKCITLELVISAGFWEGGENSMVSLQLIRGNQGHFVNKDCQIVISGINTNNSRPIQKGSKVMIIAGVRNFVKY